MRALLALGAMPIPGPVDETVLLLAALVLVVFYRPVLREALTAARGETTSSTAPTSSR